MSNTDWKKFERLVAAIHHAETQGATVIWNDTINGRQFDVTLRFKVGLHDYLTVIECKDYKDRVAVEKVDAFVTKARDVNANKAVFVSSNGYQSGCFAVAARHGIRLLTLDEKIDVDVDEIAAEIVPALNIFNVRFILQGGKEYDLEDEGGRLSYLMNNITLTISGRKTTPNGFLCSWRISISDLQPEREYEQVMAFPKETVATVPYEGEVKPEGIKFCYKLTKAFIPKAPIIDTHVLEGIRTFYELTDENGNVVRKLTAREINLGFDTKLEAGKFYFTPSLHNYDYCEKIENNLAHFIMIESYQFGMLIQARLVLETKYSAHYVEVTDKKRLERLKKMLNHFLKTKS
ncbi:MAG: restriction endonuclease [Deltaproteobacteria bacterium]|nr:restriction endonuclease [Deltaproteobacteria bacterium]